MNRHEILFIYDVTNTNPNGDPLDENRPRIDEATGINLVTDVRLKRTIRDYFNDYKKIPVFILEKRKEDGKLQSKEERVADNDINTGEDMLDKFIDIRLFGGVTAIKKNTMVYTGPVQFKLGYSLHRVEIMHIKGTTVMPSGKDKGQGTFREEYILPYSLICFYGIINENSAIQTKLTENDIELLFEGIWNGTKNLISRSKAGQIPRLLIDIEYKTNSNFHIGEIDKYVSLESSKPDNEVRDIQDVVLNINKFNEIIEKNKNKISAIKFKKDERLQINQKFNFENCEVSGFNF